MSTSKALIEWGHTVLSLPSVETLYNYRERETPKRFNPDPTLAAFHIYTTNRSRKPRVQPLKNNGATDGRSWALKFHDARKHVVHEWDSDIRGLRLNYDGGAWAMWDDNKARFCNLLENKPRFAKAISDPNLHPTGVTPLWVLRGFFIGPDARRCPPYITVMCSKESLSRHLVDYIQGKLQSLQENDLADWGVTRLPNVHVSEFGSPIESPGSSSEELPQHEEKDKSAQEIRIHLTERDLPVTIPSDETRASWDNRQHRSGIRLRISEDSIVYRQATIGGLVQVGEDIFGLTVAHVFSSEYSAQRSDVQEQQQNPVTAPNQDSEARMGDNSTLSGRWRNPFRQSMVFDWALVEMPSIETYNPRPEEWEDVNLVETISGDFRPVLVIPEMPVNGIPVALATPGAALCLRGIVTGEDAFVNMPGSPNPYITWVLRMEQPWLIRSGDSGSWAFDAGSGDLLGILVAGCPELHEAYIIPAYQVFGDIRRTLGKDVRLPNCYPLTGKVHQELSHLEKTILGFKADMKLQKVGMDPVSVLELERIEKGVAPYFTRAQTVFSKDRQDPQNHRETGSGWWTPSELQSLISEEMKKFEDNFHRVWLPWESLTFDDTQLYKDNLRRSPLECFNFFLNKLKDIWFGPYSRDQDRHITVLALLWVHLILGERSLKISSSDVSTAGYNISQVIEDERRSCANYSIVDLPRDRRSITAAFVRIQHRLEVSIYMVKKRCYATLPDKAPFDLENVNNPMLLVAVLLNESENRILVLDPPIDANRSWRFLGLPCIQVNEALDEEQNLELFLSTKMGLENTSYDQAEKLELEPRHSRFWLEGPNTYVDVTAYKVILSDEEWKSTSSRLYEMDVVGVDLEYAAKKVWGWHYIRILQFLGYN
ncbi:peptidase (PNG1) [Fusarium mundagurra]|uniref:Peptidase (PNG1) n=1 Tax=Fusarium mundagurra TaxID=1567541 RepID=A0A8H5Y9B5_9HYPO|nr:peptidase (PNG1) [Fusarium mundagurra]